MSKFQNKFISITALICALSILNGCGDWRTISAAAPPPPPLPAAQPMPSDDVALESSVRFLEDRVKMDPKDFIAFNLLSGHYLRLMRERGSVTYLELASKTVHASLAVSPRKVNTGALNSLIYVEQASHDFAAAREDAKELIKLDARQIGAYQQLEDSLIELGDYNKAKEAHREMEQRPDYSPQGIASMEVRRAKLSSLYGSLEDAEKHLTSAVAQAVDAEPPSRELIAFYRWTLGDTLFAMGKYEEAENNYRDALTTFPDYYRAVASLARVRAAQGDLNDAILQYEKAVKLLPDPNFVAALGDLYKLTGRDKDAQAQYELVEQIGKLSKLNGAIYNRQLALFYADHDQKPEEGYNLAAKEYEARKDIYGADALAWTAMKAGKIGEAQTAMKEAMKLGTQDAKLYYHAGMIARAAGDKGAAKENLEKALKLNPKFDPLQSSIALKALAE